MEARALEALDGGGSVLAAGGADAVVLAGRRRWRRGVSCVAGAVAAGIEGGGALVVCGARFIGEACRLWGRDKVHGGSAGDSGAMRWDDGGHWLCIGIGRKVGGRRL
jgi:hypothetical protein